MKLRFRVDLSKKDRMAIAHSQGLTVASTEEDCHAAITKAIDDYLDSVRERYTEHLFNKQHNLGKSDGN